MPTVPCSSTRPAGVNCARLQRVAEAQAAVPEQPGAEQRGQLRLPARSQVCEHHAMRLAAAALLAQGPQPATPHTKRGQTMLDSAEVLAKIYSIYQLVILGDRQKG